MGMLSFKTNNGGKLCWSQEEHDSTVKVYRQDKLGSELKCVIPAGDMVVRVKSSRDKEVSQ